MWWRFQEAFRDLPLQTRRIIYGVVIGIALICIFGLFSGRRRLNSTFTEPVAIEETATVTFETAAVSDTIPTWANQAPGDACTFYLDTGRLWSKSYGNFAPLNPATILPDCPAGARYQLIDEAIRLGEQVHTLRLESTIDDTSDHTYEIYFDDKLVKTATGAFYFDGDIVYDDRLVGLFFGGAADTWHDAWLMLDHHGYPSDSHLEAGFSLQQVSEATLQYRQYSPEAVQLQDSGREDYAAFCQENDLTGHTLYAQDYFQEFSFEAWSEPLPIEDTMETFAGIC